MAALPMVEAIEGISVGNASLDDVIEPRERTGDVHIPMIFPVTELPKER